MLDGEEDRALAALPEDGRWHWHDEQCLQLRAVVKRGIVRRMLGILRRATADQIDEKVYGFVTVEVDGQVRAPYCFTFPMLDDPGLGFEVIERLSGTTREAVLEGWSDDGSTNWTAVQAMAAIESLYRDRAIVLGQEHPSVGSSRWVDLRPLPIDVAPSQPPNSVDEIEVEPEYEWTTISQMYVQKGETDDDPENLVIEFHDAAPVRFEVPSPRNHTPVAWWFVEVFTNISHENVALGYDKRSKRNPPLEDTVRRLYEALSEYEVPHRDGHVDVERWRQKTVRARWSRGILPCLFPNRPTYDLKRTRKLLHDVCGGTLFVFDAEPGARRGRPAQIQQVRGRPALVLLDVPKLAKQVLGNYIHYSRAGKPTKYIYPPDEIVDSFIYLPDMQLPRIKGITRIPVMRPDGTVLDRSGYDPTSQLWYAPEVKIDALPDPVTENDVAEAKALILTPFAEFPFVAECDRTAVIAALLEQIVRPMIFGPRPLYIFDATSPGTGKCVTGDSLLVTSRGLVYIDEIKPLHDGRTDPDDSSATIYNLETPFSVPTMQGAAHATVFYDGGTKPTFMLTTKRGFELRGTAVHPVFVAADGQIVERRLVDVKPGDFVALSVGTTADGCHDEIDEDCAWLLGALIADGTLKPGNRPMSYSKCDAHMRRRVAKFAARYLGASPVDVPRHHYVRLNDQERIRKRAAELGLTLDLAARKSIPRSVRYSSPKIWRAFLAGLFDGDSSVDIRQIEFSSASKQLAKEVQVMLAALGVWAARNPKTVKLPTWNESRTYWRLHITGQDVDAFAQVIPLTHKKKRKALQAVAPKRNTNNDVVPGMERVIAELSCGDPRFFKESRGQRRPSRRRLRAAFPKDERIAAMTADNLRWDEVVSITPNGDEPVYDLTVPGPHHYVANGFYVHNSLCAQIIQVIITGGEPTISALGARDEEIEKRITSYLREGMPVIILDNLVADVKAQALQQLATSQYWQARLLGGNDAPKIPQIATWIMTLNNARVNSDMSRRTVLSRMDAKMDKAWKRSGFKISNILDWSRERRTEIIRALLILARAWVEAGRPMNHPKILLGGFEAWAGVVGGILHHNGFRGLEQAAERAAAERGIEHEDHLWLVKGWLEVGGQPKAAIELADLANALGLYQSRLEKAKQPVARGRAMTAILRDLSGQPLGGYVVQRAKELSNGYVQYVLTPAET